MFNLIARTVAIGSLSTIKEQSNAAACSSIGAQHQVIPQSRLNSPSDASCLCRRAVTIMKCNLMHLIAPGKADQNDTRTRKLSIVPPRFVFSHNICRSETGFQALRRSGKIPGLVSKNSGRIPASEGWTRRISSAVLNALFGQ